QLRRLRPDLEIVPIRGNVETRLKKVENGEVDATLLAAAGLKRLEIDAGTAIPTEILLPAPGQAVIGMECRTNDTRTQSVLSTVSNGITYNCVMAERAFTRALGATCHSPVAAFCAFEDGDLRLRAQLFSEDGADMVEGRAVLDGGEGLQALRRLKVYAVGEATAEAARVAGFNVAATGDAGVDCLLSSIDPDLKLLHLCGADRATPSDARQAITPVAIYRSTPRP